MSSALNDHPRSAGQSKSLAIGDHVVASAAFCLLMAIFYPGYMSNDSFGQLAMARTGHFSNAHPPVVSWIWRYMDRIVEGQALMFVCNTLVYLWSLVLLRSQVLPKGWWYTLYIMLFGALYPPIFGVLGVVWKDVFMQSYALIGLALGLKSIECRPKLNIVLFSVSQGLLLLAVCSRHNALFLVPAIEVALAWRLLQFVRRDWGSLGRSIAVLTLAGFLSGSLGISVILLNRAITDQESHFGQYTQVFDIAGTSIAADKNLFDTKNSTLIVRNFGLDDLKRKFHQGFHPTLYRETTDEKEPKQSLPPLFKYTTNPVGLDALRSNWITAITSHPTSWLNHRARFSEYLLGLKNRPLFCPVPHTAMADKKYGYQFQPRWANSAYHKLAQRLVATPLYRPYAYFCLSLLLLVVCAARFLFTKSNRLHWFLSICLLTSGLSYQLSFMLFSTSHDFRYSLWLITTTMLAAALVLHRCVQRLFGSLMPEPRAECFPSRIAPQEQVPALGRAPCSSIDSTLV